ncbi:MAG: UDP-N-acetylmuramoyl-L-alanine--D-glutamate ligase, partial [Chlamydiales bacterium]|nr:UDP-N-acetylmuramoyl-L-alanine--D-glutamate ligase [Chlamydiales bacterium]
MKKVAVLGLGKSGISAAHFLQKMGYDVVGIDDKLVSKPDFLTIITSEDASKGIQDFDFVVTSPGI